MNQNKFTIHELKIHPFYYSEVKLGLKNFEVRKKDRDYKIGDILHLRKHCNGLNEHNEIIQKVVTYVLDDKNYVKNGFVILSLNPLPCKSKRITIHQKAEILKQYKLCELREGVDPKNEGLTAYWNGRSDALKFVVDLLKIKEEN